MQRIFTMLQHDADLEAGPAIFALVVTESHFLIRFHSYLGYLAKLWELCMAYNPHGYIIAVEQI